MPSLIESWPTKDFVVLLPHPDKDNYQRKRIEHILQQEIQPNQRIFRLMYSDQDIHGRKFYTLPFPLDCEYEMVFPWNHIMQGIPLPSIIDYITPTFGGEIGTTPMISTRTCLVRFPNGIPSAIEEWLTPGHPVCLSTKPAWNEFHYHILKAQLRQIPSRVMQLLFGRDKKSKK